MKLTTQSQVRQEFWANMASEPVPGRRQNDYPVDIRMAWVDFVDSLARDGTISEQLAHRVTL